MHKFLLITGALCALSFAIVDSANRAFLDDIEQRLRGEYISCTGDTSRVPISKIRAWKRIIDSLATLPSYPTIATEYRKKTGLRPEEVGPCAVALWKMERDSIILTIDTKAKKDLTEQIKKREDSASVAKITEEGRRMPCLLGEIPFGVPKEVFVKLAALARLDSLTGDETAQRNYLICKKVPVDNRFFVGAFYFDTGGRYVRYELESRSFPVDSLDSLVWPEAKYFASFFEKKIGAMPLRTSRISRDEIKQGRLSLYKVWSKPDWSVSIGLSRHKFRYYAKAVVMNRPLPTE
ncbi:MAG: hypothetical protein MUF22_01945 [Chitinispirillaceae bacterium]|jgi:hypothetical protein|nr:hypothetical protein [Chitinispirillaceae bacterium]